MKFIHLHIKNMVCDHCIKVVADELKKNGLKVNAIKLGEAEISSDKEIDLGKVKEVLEKNGFELLEDKNYKIIEKIKNLIIVDGNFD
jgi:AraC family transcriptional regulator